MRRLRGLLELYPTVLAAMATKLPHERAVVMYLLALPFHQRI